MNTFFKKRGRRLKQALILFISLYLVMSPVAAGAIAAAQQQRLESIRTSADDQEAATEQNELDRDRQRLDQSLLPYSLEGAIDPDTYILGPADELILIFQGAEELVKKLEILPEGSVVLPNLGPFEAAGFTLTEFRERLISALSRYYKNVNIDCRLSVPRTFLTYVLGEVKHPGAVKLFAPFRLSTALEQAGGVGEGGSMRSIEIRQDGRVVRTADLFAFLYMGRSDANLIVQEGQTIYVPPRQSTATSIGELRKPATFEFIEGETVADLIRFSGGINSRGDTTRVILEQFDEGKRIATTTHSLSECTALKLRDQDVVVVPDIMSYPGRAFVNVKGGGGRTGVFFITEGETLKDFLGRIWRFREMYDMRRGVLERRSAGGEAEYLYLDLHEVVSGGEAGTIQLRDKDVITIPAFEQNVYVVGEVTIPGEVEFTAGLTAKRYISLAGGPNERGSMTRLEIYSSNGMKRDADANSEVYRGETIIVKRKTSTIISGIVLGMATITGLLLSIIAITK